MRLQMEKTKVNKRMNRLVTKQNKLCDLDQKLTEDNKKWLIWGKRWKVKWIQEKHRNQENNGRFDILAEVGSQVVQDSLWDTMFKAQQSFIKVLPLRFQLWKQSLFLQHPCISLKLRRKIKWYTSYFIGYKVVIEISHISQFLLFRSL